MNTKYALFGFLILFYSCKNKTDQSIPVSNRGSIDKISSGTPNVFDTIVFTKLPSGLNYSGIDTLELSQRPDIYSHVILEYKLFDRKGELLCKIDSSDNVFQLYVKNCEIPLMQAITLLSIDSKAQYLIDGKSVSPLYQPINENVNYLLQLKLVDYHQHYD